MINANIIPPLLSLLANVEFDVKKEAAWAVSNATTEIDGKQIKYEDFFGYVIFCIHLFFL